MIHPFLENTAKTIQYILIWVVYALLQTFVLYWLIALPTWILLLDGFIHAALFGLLGILLWSVVMYGNYAVLSVFQRTINYLALAVLSLGLWLGIGYGLFYWIFDTDLVTRFTPLLPMRGLTGLLIYLLIIQQFKYSMQQQTDEIVEEIQPEPIKEVSKSKADEHELLERVAVKSGSKIHVVLVSDILYLQADGDYVQIFSSEGKYLKEQTMKYFEEHLPSNQFVRVHRSCIVNVEMISRIELYEKQNQLLTLKNGQQIKTSPAGYKALRMALNL
ncbi:MAG: LytTR family DNA-binding domain-containing protein [Paludibacter sp.]|nr:LytTR family DNA-binding domain-containing protein [Paludibacter sp.]